MAILSPYQQENEVDEMKTKLLSNNLISNIDYSSVDQCAIFLKSFSNQAQHLRKTKHFQDSFVKTNLSFTISSQKLSKQLPLCLLSKFKIHLPPFLLL